MSDEFSEPAPRVPELGERAGEQPEAPAIPQEVATRKEARKARGKRGPSLERAVTNIDVTTVEGKARLFSCGNPADLDFVADAPVEIVATHYAIYEDEAADEETGEVKRFARTVLMDRQGRTFKTTAEHGPERMQQAMLLFAPEDWAAGIHFVITRRIGKRGQMYHDIRVKVH